LDYIVTKSQKFDADPAPAQNDAAPCGSGFGSGFGSGSSTLVVLTSNAK
jgi:hypothetical protein